jgi:hypothetical protein
MSHLSLLHPIVPWSVDLFDRFDGKLKFVAFFSRLGGYRLPVTAFGDTLRLRSRGRLSLVKAVLHPTINSTRHVYLRSRLFPTISFPPHFPPRPPSPPASPWYPGQDPSTVIITVSTAHLWSSPIVATPRSCARRPATWGSRDAEDDGHLRFLRQSCIEAKRRRRGGESADETGVVIFR